MPIVKMPDGVLVDIPDDADPKTRAEMELYMSPPQPSAGQRVADQTRAVGREIGGEVMNLPRTLGLTARDFLTGVSGTLGTVGDAAVGAKNAVLGTDSELPTVGLRKFMDAHLPQPNPGLETGVNNVATLVAGAMDPAMNAARGLFAPSSLYNAPTAAAQRAEQVNAARDAGYKMTPAEAGAGPLPRMLGRVLGNDQLESMGRYQNQGVTDSLIKKQAGIGQNQPINEATLAQAVENAIPARASVRDLPALRQLADEIGQAHIGLTNSGHANAGAFANAADSGLPLGGNYATVANAARMAPGSTGLGLERPSFMTPKEWYGALGMGPASLLLGHLPHLAWTSALPVGRAAARAGLMSNLGQQLLTNPAVPGAADGLWQNALPTAYNLGSGLFGQ